MRRRQALRLGAGVVAGSLSVTAGCAGIGTQATAAIKLNNNTDSAVFFRVDTETTEGAFSREIEVILPWNGRGNDPWFKEMFVDRGEYQVRVRADTVVNETTVTHPSGDWDYVSISMSESGLTTETYVYQ